MRRRWQGDSVHDRSHNIISLGLNQNWLLLFLDGLDVWGWLSIRAPCCERIISWLPWSALRRIWPFFVIFAEIKSGVFAEALVTNR